MLLVEAFYLGRLAELFTKRAADSSYWFVAADEMRAYPSG